LWSSTLFKNKIAVWVHVNYDHVIFKIRILKSLNIVFNKYRLKYTLFINIALSNFT